MSFPDPTLALSSRREAFRKHYHDKMQVNMSFHDTPQQPARPPGVVPDARRYSGWSAADGTAPAGDLPPDPPEETCDPEQFPGERHHRDSLDRLERAGPFNPPENGVLAPDHDKT